MATSPISGLPSAAPEPPKKHKTTLDQADFLALMTAQLKNQDPTKPVDNSEYVAQMAQFSTVSGLAQSNTTLAAIAAKLDQLIAATVPVANQSATTATPAQE